MKTRLSKRRRRRAQPIRGLRPYTVYRPRKHRKQVFPDSPPLPHRERRRREPKRAAPQAYSKYRPPHNKARPLPAAPPHSVYRPKRVIEWDKRRVALYSVLALLLAGLGLLLYYLLA